MKFPEDSERFLKGMNNLYDTVETAIYNESLHNCFRIEILMKLIVNFAQGDMAKLAYFSFYCLQKMSTGNLDELMLRQQYLIQQQQNQQRLLAMASALHAAQHSSAVRLSCMLPSGTIFYSKLKKAFYIDVIRNLFMSHRSFQSAVAPFSSNTNSKKPSSPPEQQILNRLPCSSISHSFASESKRIFNSELECRVIYI
uniref:NR LBD domain-containing protein n=1 Tax=Brugia timori TaxID=42155 RepID=A0A0R3R9I9_9BILA